MDGPRPETLVGVTPDYSTLVHDVDEHTHDQLQAPNEPHEAGRRIDEAWK